MDTFSDNHLMLKVKNGDLDQLGLLFERYNRRLFGFFYRLTLRTDISEDLVQMVFERILKYRQSYNGDGEFSTWIYRIAHNIHADHYKSQAKAPLELLEVDPETMGNIYDEDAESESFQTEQQRILKMALAKLDPDKMKVLMLSRYEGLKYKEIALVLKCSESAVKVRVFRALNDLKEIFTAIKKKTAS